MADQGESSAPFVFERLQTSGNPTGRIHRITWSPDGNILAGATYDRVIWLWTAATRQWWKKLGEGSNGHTKLVTSVTWSPDGKELASGSDDTTIRIWNVDIGLPLNRPLTGHTGYVTSVAWSPDGNLLASGSDDWTVRVWDVTTRKKRWQKKHGDRVLSVAWSPDGKILVLGPRWQSTAQGDPTQRQGLLCSLVPGWKVGCVSI
jgi:WD40 repeat protein